MFQRALADLAALPGEGHRGEVVVTDVNPLSPAVHLADRACRVPFAHEPGYIDAILETCVGHEVGLVVPTIDDELPLFGEARERFAHRGIAVAASARQTADICNDKLATSAHLAAAGVPAARAFLRSTLPDPLPERLFVKPRHGRGGVGAFAARTRRELLFFLDYVPDPVVQEYLEGPEFTIDMLCDFTGRVLSVVPRERVVIRAGVSDRGRTVHDRALIGLALETARVLEFAGAINIQCRVVDGQPTIFEINPRFSGGIALTVAAGADFPRWLVELARGAALEPRIGHFVPNLWMTSFESSLFLEADVLGAFEAGPTRRSLRHAS
jgi:carbamoyl-phosphate synthase large subunit